MKGFAAAAHLLGTGHEWFAVTPEIRKGLPFHTQTGLWSGQDIKQ
jgi:hypothetical protein